MKDACWGDLIPFFLGVGCGLGGSLIGIFVSHWLLKRGWK